MSQSSDPASAILYFAYGANMDTDELTRRVGAVEQVAIGHLADHRLVFNRHGTLWDGGVSSVVGSTGEKVFGVVWRLSPEALAKLDAIEDPAAYDRLEMEVMTDAGHRLLCQVYVSYPQGERAPAPAYLALLISAARKAHLPEAHIEMLLAHQDRD